MGRRPATPAPMANSEQLRGQPREDAPVPIALPPTALPTRGHTAAMGPAIRRHLALASYAAPALAVYATFVLWPLLRLVGLSLTRWDGYGTPSFVGLANYRDLWLDPGFAVELEHSVTWLATTLVVPSLAGLALALLLAGVP